MIYFISYGYGLSISAIGLYLLLWHKDLTIDEFEGLVTKYTDFSLEEILSTPYKTSIIPSTDFETKNATLIFDLEGDVTKFDNIKFSLVVDLLRLTQS